MATAPSPAPGSDAHASFVGKLVADPRQPPNTLLLTGFLGASSDEGHTRLYFDAQLSDYVEIPDDAILHRQDVPAGLSPLGASYVWVRRDATLIHGPIGPDRLKASFLEGRVARDHAAAAAAAVPHLPPVTAPIICDITDLPPRCHPTTLPVCRPTQPPACPPVTSLAAGCPAPTTPAAGCPVPTTPAAGCPAATHVGPLCVATVFAPICHPTLVGPACGVTHAECPPVTLPPHCPVTHLVCPPVTLPPHCVPHTLAGPACPVTHLLCPPVTQPPHCVPQTVFSPACGHTVFGPACGAVTALVVCQLTHGGPACVPATGLPGCAPSLAGCPSGIACNPGTVGNPGLPGAMG